MFDTGHHSSDLRFSIMLLGVERTPKPIQTRQVIGAQNPDRAPPPYCVPRSWYQAYLFIESFHIKVPFLYEYKVFAERVLRIAALSIMWLSFGIYPLTILEILGRLANQRQVSLTQTKSRFQLMYLIPDPTCIFSVHSTPTRYWIGYVIAYIDVSVWDGN